MPFPSRGIRSEAVRMLEAGERVLTVTGLKPGAYYILSYHSTDEADVDRPGTPCRDFVLRVELVVYLEGMGSVEAVSS